jgi:hypothetical protein
MIYYLYHDEYPVFRLWRPEQSTESDRWDQAALQLPETYEEESRRYLWSEYSYYSELTDAGALFLQNHSQRFPEYRVYARLMMVLLVHIYIAADKYDVPSLRAKVLGDFKEMLKVDYLLDSEEFVEAVPLIYEATRRNDPGMRQAVVVGMYRHRVTLVQKEAVKNLLATVEGLACDLVLYQHEREHVTST